MITIQSIIILVNILHFNIQNIVEIRSMMQILYGLIKFQLYKRYILFMQASRNIQTQSRRRQFQNIRNQHSRNSRNSRASYSNNQSLRSSMVSKYDHEIIKTPRNATRRINQRLRESNDRIRTEHDYKSATKLLCVGCFNHELHEARLRKKQRQARNKQKQMQQITMIQKFNEEHASMRNKMDVEFDKMRQYNYRKIQDQRCKKKDNQRRQRQRNARERYQEEIQNQKRVQHEARINHERRQKIRQELQDQIKKRRAKIIQEQMENKRQPASQTFIGDGERKMQYFEQNYRKQLLKQINDGKERKKKLQDEEKMRKSYQTQMFVNEAAERQRVNRIEAERRRYQLLEEAKKRRELIQKKQYEKRVKRQQEEQQRRAILADESRIRYEKETAKKNRNMMYVHELKRQIQDKQIRKQEQEAYQKVPMGNILTKRSSIIERQCDSCEKKYPQQYLTQVVEPFEV